jgi:hypothetical protein
VQPTRATQYQHQLKKEGNLVLVGGSGADDLVQLDRWADEVLFKACETLMGISVPAYLQRKSFPASIVAEAKGAAA